MALSDPCFKSWEPVYPPGAKPPKPGEPGGPGGPGEKPRPPGPCGPDGKPMSWCDLALAAFWRAWWTWHNTLGYDVASYKVGTRALTRKSDLDAWNALDRAIAWVRAACGPGALPPGIEDMGQPLAIRGVPSDV